MTGFPPTVTVLVPCVDPNPEPLMLNVSFTPTVAGDMEVMEGFDPEPVGDEPDLLHPERASTRIPAASAATALLNFIQPPQLISSNG